MERDNHRSGGFSRSGGHSRSGGFRSNNGFRRNNNFDRGPREMHKATCTECQAECEVPFKPTEGKDVFCKDCFSKRRPPRRF